MHDQRYRLTTAEFDRWAEPLEDNIGEVLAENLSLHANSDHVMAYPWNDGVTIDYSIRVRVHRFGSDPSGAVVLGASWSIHDSDGDLVTLRKARYTDPRRATDVLTMVAAMSDTLEQMSRDIALSLPITDSTAHTGSESR